MPGKEGAKRSSDRYPTDGSLALKPQEDTHPAFDGVPEVEETLDQRAKRMGVRVEITPRGGSINPMADIKTGPVKVDHTARNVALATAGLAAVAGAVEAAANAPKIGAAIDSAIAGLTGPGNVPITEVSPNPGVVPTATEKPQLGSPVPVMTATGQIAEISPTPAQAEAPAPTVVPMELPSNIKGDVFVQIDVGDGGGVALVNANETKFKVERVNKDWARDNGTLLALINGYKNQTELMQAEQAGLVGPRHFDEFMGQKNVNVRLDKVTVLIEPHDNSHSAAGMAFTDTEKILARNKNYMYTASGSSDEPWFTFEVQKDESVVARFEYNADNYKLPGMKNTPEAIESPKISADYQVLLVALKIVADNNGKVPPKLWNQAWETYGKLLDDTLHGAIDDNGLSITPLGG